MSNNSIYATYIPYIPLIEYNIDYSELLNRQFKEDIQVLSESPYKGGNFIWIQNRLLCRQIEKA
jgi:hypothetical protein